jgi:hypothetical protein
MQKHVITEWYIENARGQKNARSVGNVQHVAANVQNGEAAPSAFPEDDAADAERTEKQNAKPGAVGKYGVEEKGRAAAAWV